MKIQRLKLENFRSYPNLDIELPGRITVFRGGNHRGKSTIEQGVQYALAARSEGTNAAGAGADETLIRNGCDLARIYLDLEIDGNLDKLRATISRKSGRTLATKDSEGVDTTATINPWLRTHAEVISCLTNSRYFVDLDAAKQKDILSSIVLPQTCDGWDIEMLAAADAVGIDNSAWMTEHPFTVIGTTYDIAFEMRKNTNRDIKNFVAPNGDFTDAGDVDEIKDRLKERRDQLGDAQKRRATMVANAVSPETIASRKRSVQERIQRAETKHAEETRSLTEHQAKILDKKQLKTNQTLAAQSKLAASLDMDIASREIELKTVKAAIAAADGLEAECMTCKQAITEEVKVAILKPLIEQQSALLAAIREAKEQRAAIGDFALAATALTDHAAAEKEVARTTERLQEANADLNAANIDLEAIGEATEVDTTDVDAEIADLNSRIEKGTARLQSIVAANERKTAFDAATAKFAVLKEKSALLEKLVAYFGPSGVQAKLLQEHVGAFTASMNEVLEVWGYKCSLSFEPTFFFGIVTQSNDTAKIWGLRTLSKSERYRFAIAFQVALAMHTGFRLVVIDETDMLDSQGRGGLMQQIVASGLDHAILLGTDERDTISPGMAAVADFFMISSALVDGIPTSSVARIHAAV
ncbi:MAG TPA: AAA family ATPase [Edaphobacter sp.]|nr:AAA family ATPase [Edaphobacter sp.]